MMVRNQEPPNNLETADDVLKMVAKTTEKLRAGCIDRKNATAIFNATAKIIDATKLQLEYFRDREEIPFIPFIHCATSGVNSESKP